MIMNEHILNEKEKQLVNKLNQFFINERMGDFDIEADFANIPNIEFRNDLFRLVLRVKPAEPDCEEQLQIPTIIFDISIRHKGIFRRLMTELIKFCKQYENMPILFCEVVSESFATKLMNYGGLLLHDDSYSGKYIAILPEKWDEK